MRHLRFIRPVVAGVAAVGLACGLTATTALASTPKNAARPADLPTKVTWHKLTLLHGWKSSRGVLINFANPAYAVYGGIVYLDGELHLPGTNTNTEFAVLPPGYRPAHKLYLTVLSGYSGVPGTVEIRPNGVMTASSPNGSLTTRQDTSLSALSYPAAGGTWHTMALSNGWHSGATAFGTGSPAFTVRNGIAYLAGSLFTHGSNTLAGHLGINARPMSVLYISVYDHGGLAGDVEITPAGSIFVYGATARTQTALDGISYPTKAANLSWHPLPLTNGWTSANSIYQTGNPEYAVRGPIVYLAGSMYSGSNGVFMNFIPAAILPTTLNELDRQVYTFGGTTGNLSLSAPSGFALTNPETIAEQYTSLAGVAYARNS